MTEDELYKIERWMSRIDFNRRHHYRTDHSIIGVAFRHLDSLIGYIRLRYMGLEDKMKFTLGELLDSGVWESYCKHFNVDTRVLVDGISSGDDIVELNKEEMIAIGLLRRPDSFRECYPKEEMWGNGTLVRPKHPEYFGNVSDSNEED